MSLEKKSSRTIMLDSPEIAEKEKRDRKILEASRKTIVERLAEPDYLEQVQNILKDLDSGSLLVAADSHEHDEYCLMLRDVTGKIKSYGFEVPLLLNLKVAQHLETPEEVETRQTQELKTKLSDWYNQALKITKK